MFFFLFSVCGTPNPRFSISHSTSRLPFCILSCRAKAAAIRTTSWFVEECSSVATCEWQGSRVKRNRAFEDPIIQQQKAGLFSAVLSTKGILSAKNTLKTAKNRGELAISKWLLTIIIDRSTITWARTKLWQQWFDEKREQLSSVEQTLRGNRFVVNELYFAKNLSYKSSWKESIEIQINHFAEKAWMWF